MEPRPADGAYLVWNRRLTHRSRQTCASCTKKIGTREPYYFAETETGDMVICERCYHDPTVRS